MTARFRLMPPLLLTTGAVLIAGARQPGTPPPPPAAAPSYAGVIDLDQRLAALTPDDPMAYFELAEEVAYEMPDVGGRRLARRLYILAFEADRDARHPLGIGRSVCIALADMSTQQDERRWLHALAALLGDTSGVVNWDPQIRDATSRETAMALAEALGYFRAMDYRKAHRLLVRDDVEALFREYTNVVERGRDLTFLTEDAIGCPECRNSRVVRNTVSRDQPYRLCSTCAGNPGPQLSEADFLAQLRLESVLLDANHHSWSAQITVDGGEPLRDVDPDELAASFDIDPDAFWWNSAMQAWQDAPAGPALTP